MRTETLTTIKGGLNRLRTKGAALKDSLFELLNGYVTAERTVKVRPGTLLVHTIPAGTFGLVAYAGTFHVFASSDVSGIDTANFTLHILRAPDGAALSKIHFAEPFLGALYVAAEFVGGAIYHYWLQTAAAWEADTFYNVNQLAAPAVDTGFVYRATRLGPPYPVWTPDTPRTVGDKIEPTVYNGLYFEVVATVGASPRSGTAEPNFDVTLGTLVKETVDTTDTTPDPTPLPRPDPDRPDIDDRYRPKWGASRVQRD